jgi:hypothetical protein
MDCWEALFIQVLHQQKVFIDGQQVNDTNPLFQLAKTTHRRNSVGIPTHTEQHVITLHGKRIIF